MTSIDKWTKVDELKDGDTIPIHSAQNADQRGISAANAKSYFASDVADPVSATDIADASAAVNTTGKAQGKMVWDATNNRIMVASGANAASAWYVSDGSASVTPA